MADEEEKPADSPVRDPISHITDEGAVLAEAAAEAGREEREPERFKATLCSLRSVLAILTALERRMGDSCK